MNLVHIRMTGLNGGNRRERRKERTRRALLDVALACFARQGITGTRIEDITARADLGKGAFYNYFASKDDLVAALLAEAVELLDRDFLSRVESTGPLAGRVAALAEAHERFFEAHPEYPVLFHQARGLLMLDQAPASQLRGVMKDYLARLAQRLAPSAEPDGLWSEAQRLDAAAAFAGAVTGYRSHGMAAALPFQSRTVIDLVTVGLVALMERRVP